VCDNAIIKVVNQRNNAKKNVEPIIVDIKLMIDIPVDQQVVSGLLLGGILNILHQYDKIEALEDKIYLYKIDNKTLNTRIESIENWLLKQDKNLKEAKENISTLKSNSDEFKNLQDKVAFLEKDNLKV
jgi:hypothetical protein